MSSAHASPPPSIPASRWLCALLLMLLATSFGSASVHAEGPDELRLRTGARLFRYVLAADIGLERKADPSGRLPVLLYGADRETSDQIKRLIAPADDGKAIRGMPLEIRTLEGLPDAADEAAGLFIASPPTAAELERLIRWSIDRRVLLYSPFEGHVERGVMAGVAIEANVRVHLNTGSLEAGDVELKPMLLKLAKTTR